MALKDAPTSVLLENVLSLIHQKLPKNSASLVERFVAKFLRQHGELRPARSQ